MNEEKIMPKGQGPVSTNGTDESVILYRSWFECLKEQGLRRFALAMIALLSFAFYNVPLESFHLPKQIEVILNTFTPIIETNRKKRNGGNKGANFGKTGGRPSQIDGSGTPMGLSNKPPKGCSEVTPMGPPNNVNVNENGNDTVSVNETQTHQSTHTNFEFFVPVFFFRNVRHPEHQAKKFVAHYAPTDWRLPGGEYMATDAQRFALAQRWEIRDDTTDRFRSDDLEMWHELYNVAPSDIRPFMVASSIQLRRTETEATIVGPKAVYEWIENNLEQTKPIILPWKGPRSYKYISPEK